MFKGNKAKLIQQELAGMYAEQGYKIGAVKYWIAEIRSGRQDLRDEPKSGRPPISEIDLKICHILKEEPFSSVRSIAADIHESGSTVYDHLTKSLGFVERHFKLIPHELTDELRMKRIKVSKQMLTVLQAQKKLGYRDVITGDETWVFLKKQKNSLWLPSDQSRPTKVTLSSFSEKQMLTIFWSVNGILLKYWLPPEMNFNAQTFFENVLLPLSNRCCTGLPKKANL